MSRLLKARETWLALAIIALLVLITLRAPGFARPDNLASIFNDTSILIILALGQMVVILTRSIDLSVAANVALSGMIVALVNQAYPGVPVALVIVVALIVGAAAIVIFAAAASVMNVGSLWRTPFFGAVLACVAALQIGFLILEHNQETVADVISKRWRLFAREEE